MDKHRIACPCNSRGTIRQTSPLHPVTPFFDGFYELQSVTARAYKYAPLAGNSRANCLSVPGEQSVGIGIVLAPLASRVLLSCWIH